MPDNQWTGQPGNALPFETDATTNIVRPPYMLWPRMPLTNSSAQSLVLRTSDAGLIVRGANASGSTITLPPPEPGLSFWFYFTGVATSAATVIRTHSSLVDMISGGGNTKTTNTGVQLEDINHEQGMGAIFVGLSTARWALFPQGAQVSSAYTSDAASTLVAQWGSVDSTG